LKNGEIVKIDEKREKQAFSTKTLKNESKGPKLARIWPVHGLFSFQRPKNGCFLRFLRGLT
jgi:hypothetical protein